MLKSVKSPARGGVASQFAFGPQALLPVAKQVERAAVERRGAVGFYGLAVLAGGVALVALPVVLGVLQREAVHVVVAVGLGKYAGCGYG